MDVIKYYTMFSNNQTIILLNRTDMFPNENRGYYKTHSARYITNEISPNT